MASQIDIINRGLDHLGTNRIASLSENNTAARTMSGLYDSVRDARLRSHPWNFAMRRKELAAKVVKPAFGYSEYFAQPADCLRVYEVFDANLIPIDEWDIEGDDEETVIACNCGGPIYIRYIARIVNTERYDVMFNELLSADLALAGENKIADMADTEAQRIASIYAKWEMKTKGVDGQEGTPDELPTESWIDTRY